MESCDEAERELIYRSAYQSYSVVSRCIPVQLVIMMLWQLCLNTGILAVVMVDVIWLTVTVSYLNFCVHLRKEKLK